MAVTIELTCGTMVPGEVIDQLAFTLMMDEDISAVSISNHIRMLDVRGKLLEKLEEALGWTPPS